MDYCSIRGVRYAQGGYWLGRAISLIVVEGLERVPLGHGSGKNYVITRQSRCCYFCMWKHGRTWSSNICVLLQSRRFHRLFVDTEQTMTKDVAFKHCVIPSQSPYLLGVAIMSNHCFCPAPVAFPPIIIWIIWSLDRIQGAENGRKLVRFTLFPCVFLHIFNSLHHFQDPHTLYSRCVNLNRYRVIN